jgi:hypothetical protein
VGKGIRLLLEEITLASYAMKGAGREPDVPRLQRPLSAFNFHSVKYLVIGG